MPLEEGELLRGGGATLAGIMAARSRSSVRAVLSAGHSSTTSRLPQSL
jgi:hypothetical protein